MFSKESYLRLFLFIIIFLFFIYLYRLILGNIFGPPLDYLLYTLPSIFNMFVLSNFSFAWMRYKDLQFVRNVAMQGGGLDLKDGQKVFFCGRILPEDGIGTKTPFTDNFSVFYSYSIYRYISRRDRPDDKDDDFSGLCFVQSYIQSPVGKLKIAGFPLLEGFDERVVAYSDENHSLFENAQSYIQKTSWEDFSGVKIGNSITMVKGFLDEKIRGLRKDLRFHHNNISLGNRYLSESYIPVGSEVCLIGSWSQEDQCITSNLKQKIALTIISGTFTEAVQKIKGSIKKKIIEGFLIFVFMNFIIFVFWWITNIGVKYGDVTITKYKDGVIEEQTVVNEDFGKFEVFYESDIPWSFKYPNSWSVENKVIEGWDYKNNMVVDSQSTILSDSVNSYSVMSIVQEINDTDCQMSQSIMDVSEEEFEAMIIGDQESVFIEKLSGGYYMKHIFIPVGNHCGVVYIQYPGNYNQANLFNSVLDSLQLY